MESCVKHFTELTAEELFRIYKLRVSVFVVEQKCAYQEVDDIDTHSYHMWLQDENGIQAYMRILPKDGNEVSFGRVIAVKRHCGLGSEIVNSAVKFSKEKLNANRITLDAQTYARKLYENIGFVQTGDEFSEDNIPHIPMTLEIR